MHPCWFFHARQGCFCFTGPSVGCLVENQTSSVICGDFYAQHTQRFPRGARSTAPCASKRDPWQGQTSPSSVSFTVQPRCGQKGSTRCIPPDRGSVMRGSSSERFVTPADNPRPARPQILGQWRGFRRVTQISPQTIQSKQATRRQHCIGRHPDETSAGLVSHFYLQFPFRSPTVAIYRVAFVAVTRLLLRRILLTQSAHDRTEREVAAGRFSDEFVRSVVQHARVPQRFTPLGHEDSVSKVQICYGIEKSQPERQIVFIRDGVRKWQFLTRPMAGLTAHTEYRVCLSRCRHLPSLHFRYQQSTQSKALHHTV